MRAVIAGAGIAGFALALRLRRAGVEVSLSDGSHERVELLVGADGVHSGVRELAFGPEARFELPLGHTTAAFVLDRIPTGVSERDFTMRTAPGHMLAVYPIRGGWAATFLVHTQIELPALHYPTGYAVRVTGGAVLSVPDANLLRLGNQSGARTVQVTVTPANRHPGAPGPFVWPLTAARIASADCPAQAGHAIQIRYTRHRAPILRVLVYVDGQHVATTHARRVRWIELPAGLADGSVIRLVANTARGHQFTASRRLNGCSPSPAGAWIISTR